MPGQQPGRCFVHLTPIGVRADRAAGIRTLPKIGDCDLPGAVVHATCAGHPLARKFDANVVPMLFERSRLG